MGAGEEGLRERKKRETRQRIADIAMGLFLQRGFDNVTVAEVARTADVSVNTVFNYFPTKEDLFLDRSDEVESLPRKVIEGRRPGETAVQALRRDFFDALDTGDWRYGMHEGSDLFARRVRESPSLSARLTLLDYRREEQFAKALADATDADPDDLTPWLVASQMNAALRTLIRRFTMRQMAGEDTGRILEDIRLDAELAFDLLEDGVGDYALRQAEKAGTTGDEVASDRVQT
ncbi:TetR/AcrR family transcriptional regulator [Planotetraspora phitsanulokensis]|uniref:TetR family transcriptional regulator n=1 Tax=Planotetraspora phitsanulokensis TaxID=575192 RepID=A0A8J3XBU8_9ACTN|nr:TetR family transcriptional regulator [Planotetraspora phitsanulokensis]GII35001.1 TetR family transcriptional regulator [Planotetraspora phitsanulokensis]